MYLKAQGRGLAVAVIIGNILVNGIALGRSFWISKWTSDETLSPTNNVSSAIKQQTSNMYLGGLAGFGFSNSKSIHCTRYRNCLKELQN